MGHDGGHGQAVHDGGLGLDQHGQQHDYGDPDQADAGHGAPGGRLQPHFRGEGVKILLQSGRRRPPRPSREFFHEFLKFRIWDTTRKNLRCSDG